MNKQQSSHQNNANKTHEKAEFLLEFSPDAVFWTRQDGSFAYVNQAACSNLGYDRAELLARNIGDIDIDMDPEAWARHWLGSISSKEVRLERFHRRRDGSHFPVEVLIRNIEHQGEQVHFSYVRDLSAQKQLQAEQQNQAAFLQALFSESPAPQLIIDPADGRIVDANPAALDFYGHDIEALRALKIQQINILNPEQVHAEMALARNRERDFFRFRHRIANGEIRDVQVYSASVKHADQSWLNSTIQDVTELVQSRKQLNDYRALVERLPVGIYQNTPGPDGVFISANPALCEILDVASDQELIGRKVSDFYPESGQRAEFSELLNHIGEVRRLERQLVTAGGREIWVAISARTGRDDAGQMIFEGAIEDISEQKTAEKAERVAHQHLHEALNAAPMPIMLLRADGTIESINRAWIELSGYRADELLCLEDWFERAYDDRGAKAKNSIDDVFHGGRRRAEGDFEIRCKDGSTRTWSFWSAPLELGDNPQRLMISTAIDVTEKRRQEQKLRLSESVIQSACEGITITDADHNIRRVNKAFTAITGYSEEELVGKNPRILSSGRQDTHFYQQLWHQVHEQGHWQGEIWNRRKNGEIYPERLSIFAIRDERGEIVNYAGVFSDLTKLKHFQADLERVSNFDPLTGLPNRKLLHSLLENRLTRADGQDQHVVALVCGLDRFKLVNESFSFLAGDQLLCAVAERLKTLAVNDIDVARISGDQFVLIASRSNAARFIRQITAELLKIATTPVDLEAGQPVHFQFSTGIAIYPGDGHSAEELLRNAEIAMHTAKSANRGCHELFSADKKWASYQRLALETELRSAIESRLLDIHLQPIVSARDGRIVGAEALARWSHPERGWIQPDVFIPLAEETGLISTLSIQLLDKAAQAIVNLQKRFDQPDLRLAFNISASQLNHAGFEQTIADVLQKTQLDPTCFELELTESMMMQQVGSASTTLEKLRKRGIRISIDDFGTGFSSLAYLQEIKAHSLKIDRRFVRDVVDNQADARIASSIIAMAHALGMEVIAEGVEDQRQLEYLQAHGCDFYQGYWFSKPLPIDEFADLLDKQPMIADAGSMAD
ncbi:MAG: PAS domain S-box protein [Wenzhouxiangellaceae bacterium]|nr:PAS domain S-box protein [Wenzhouxiangellaceae bacterium]